MGDREHDISTCSCSLCLTWRQIGGIIEDPLPLAVRERLLAALRACYFQLEDLRDGVGLSVAAGSSSLPGAAPGLEPHPPHRQGQEEEIKEVAKPPEEAPAGGAKEKTPAKEEGVKKREDRKRAKDRSSTGKERSRDRKRDRSGKKERQSKNRRKSHSPEKTRAKKSQAAEEENPVAPAEGRKKVSSPPAPGRKEAEKDRAPESGRQETEGKAPAVGSKPAKDQKKEVKEESVDYDRGSPPSVSPAVSVQVATEEKREEKRGRSPQRGTSGKRSRSPRLRLEERKPRGSDRPVTPPRGPRKSLRAEESLQPPPGNFHRRPAAPYQWRPSKSKGVQHRQRNTDIYLHGCDQDRRDQRLSRR